MKRIIVLIAFCVTALVACGQNTINGNQIVGFSPFLQLEKINGQWQTTNTVKVDYGVIHNFSNVFFAGGGVGFGLSGIGAGSIITGTMPVIAFVGVQVSPLVPSVSFGAGVDAFNKLPVICINLNLYSIPISPGSILVQHKSILN